MISLGLAFGGCAVAVGNTEALLSQAGFRMISADTPQRAEQLHALAAHQLIGRTTDGRAEYVYADPKYCKCMYVGSESAYAEYKSLVQAQEAVRAYREALREADYPGRR